MNKIITLLLTIFITNCTARIISPGITSSQKLYYLGITNQLAANLYYGKDFEMNAYYILPELKEEVLFDKNNILDEGSKSNYTLEVFKQSKNKLLLFEVCMDKNKDDETILVKFQFTLNKVNPQQSFYFPYPYSYYMHEKRKKKYASYYETFQENEDNYDYLYCNRFLLEFPITSETEGKNILQVKTSENNIAEFEYIISKKEFIENTSDSSDTSTGNTVSAGRNHQFWGKGSNSQLVRIKKEK